MVERLWRTVKYEEIYLKEYRRVSDLIAALKAYFWCNYSPPSPPSHRADRLTA